jgi:imidazoleglycerol-phosphate dehydratase
MARKSEIKRKTAETDIAVRLNLDGWQKPAVKTGVPFLDHMLDSMSRHGRFQLEIECSGDYQLDDHHTVEDAGICLGKAFKKALGDKAGIKRFGNAVVPMDDALVQTAVDLSGRAYFQYAGAELRGTIGRYSEELTVEFLRAFAANAEMNLHVMLISGENRHHIHEAIFKSLGMALREAFSMDPAMNGEIPSTKGALE